MVLCVEVVVRGSSVAEEIEGKLVGKGWMVGLPPVSKELGIS